MTEKSTHKGSILVGLTGGLGSGKSLVSGEMKRLGAEVLDADLVAREIVEPGSPALEEIKREFGPGVLTGDGALDRKALGEMVFSDPERLKALNRITHPKIIKLIDRRAEKIAKEKPGTVIVVDAALLIEAGHHRRMDKVIVVYADEDSRVERLMKRDGFTAEEALRRMNSQMPLEEKLPFADIVIDNTGPRENTLEKTREVYRELSEEAAGQKA